MTLNAPQVLRESPIPDAVPPRYELKPWREQFGLVAGITGAGPGCDLALTTDDPAAGVLERWKAFRHTMAPAFTGVVVGTQRHGVTVAVHDRSAGWTIVDDTDGHVTPCPGLLLTVTVADCVPVYLAHPESGAVALLHAGWRGIAGGIIERGIARLCELGNAPAGSIVAHCGISICGQCYEVGPEVKEQVLGVREAKGGLDLRGAVAERAARAGLERVSVSAWCTAHDSLRFYSHRRSGGTAGRMVAYLGRPAYIAG